MAKIHFNLSFFHQIIWACGDINRTSRLPGEIFAIVNYILQKLSNWIFISFDVIYLRHSWHDTYFRLFIHSHFMSCTKMFRSNSFHLCVRMYMRANSLLWFRHNWIAVLHRSLCLFAFCSLPPQTSPAEHLNYVNFEVTYFRLTDSLFLSIYLGFDL